MANKKTKKQKKIKIVMDEYKRGSLKQGRSGKKVTNPKQAVAIALSEGRRVAKEKPKEKPKPKAKPPKTLVLKKRKKK